MTTSELYSRFISAATKIYYLQRELEEVAAELRRRGKGLKEEIPLSKTDQDTRSLRRKKGGR